MYNLGNFVKNFALESIIEFEKRKRVIFILDENK